MAVKSTTRSLIPIGSYIEHLNKPDGERLPVVAIETATSAVPINTFKFPERCSILLDRKGED